jgi:RNA recognition motif-containing protein
LKLFINGEPIDYKEAREEDAMFDWIMGKSTPSTTELQSQEDLDNFSGNRLAVLLVTPEEEKEALKKFMTLSLNYEDVPFAHTFSEDLKKSLEVTQKFAFVVFRDFDDGKKFLVLDELTDMSGFKQFFEAVRFPVVMDFD